MTKFGTILIKFGKFVITFLIAVLDMDSHFDTHSEYLLETSNTIQNAPTTIYPLIWSDNEGLMRETSTSQSPDGGQSTLLRLS